MNKNSTEFLHKEANDVVVLKFNNQGGLWRGQVGGKSHISRREENQDTLAFLHNFRQSLCNSVDLEDCVLVGVLDGHGRHGSAVPLTVVDCFNAYATPSAPPAEAGEGIKTQQVPASKSAEEGKTHESPPDTAGGEGAATHDGEGRPPGEKEELREETGDVEVNVSRWDKIMSSMSPMQEHDSIEDALTAMFVKTQTTLSSLKSKDFNPRYSGTTATLAFLTPENYYIANVGDSDAVVARRGSGKLEGEKVSVSHRPELLEERGRIEAAGGLVEAQRNRQGVPGKGPLRVWMKDVRTPGLMVSRSLGDVVAHDLGVIPDPTITCRSHNRGSQEELFLILASDGVWDVLPVDEAVNYVDVFSDPEIAATGLVELAVSRQRPKHYDNATAVVIFFEPPEVRKKRLLETYPDHATLEHSRKMEIEVLRGVNLGPEPEKPSQRRQNQEEDDVDHHTHVEIVQSIVKGENINSSKKADLNEAKSSSSMCSIV